MRVMNEDKADLPRRSQEAQRCDVCLTRWYVCLIRWYVCLRRWHVCLTRWYVCPTRWYVCLIHCRHLPRRSQEAQRGDSVSLSECGCECA